MLHQKTLTCKGYCKYCEGGKNHQEAINSTPNVAQRVLTFKKNMKLFQTYVKDLWIYSMRHVS